ncbi:exodeoxyribonuclease V, alpha subunit [Chlamydia ibidis]|uniref:Exodeoxyribonuclease V, alpha subunit n=2 Tax=Chlamydia ibidis TaxID=1405396 RepID=S7KK23_9CHLA|nr:exodeoxyribonuclease V subunit alpha [Chlamydia ibidis]EPP34755.1 exodeoxyribonuclease V, alpha subunit [Chlamydia ibidis]EQM63236.1 exodeoxyribonuclease V, alpha subunit [Chlamydia ibidis 10-1398/6]
MLLSRDIPYILEDVIEKQLTMPLDLAFARKHISPSNEKAFAFLAVSSALWRYGYPFLHAKDNKLCPTLPGITEEALYEYFQHVPEHVRSSLFVLKNHKIYLKSLYNVQTQLFDKLDLLSRANPRYSLISLSNNTSLTKEQQQVMHHALNSCFSIICGGPGTGKTFLAVQMILALLSIYPNIHIGVVSPTGKATSHIRQILNSYDIPPETVFTKTIHKFLQEHTYNRHSPTDLLIVDEGSMVTFNLLHNLVKTLSGKYEKKKITADALIILGDTNQLPPIGIGAGNPLQEIVVRFPERTSYLSTSHRAKTSELQNLAQSILRKEMIPFTPLPSRQSTITLLKKTFIDALSAFKKELCVLTPMRHGPWGFLSLNTLIFQEIQKTHAHLPIPVMVTERYDAWKLCNGDTGWLCPKTQQLSFPHRSNINAKDFSYYNYNYVMSIHKSQGSEYENVIILIPPGCEIFNSSLLYTAVTRAKKNVCVWADKETLRQIIQKSRNYSMLSNKFGSLS